ncbi:hypothetical protein CARUB_v10011000mg [Capsella rubella]|uniref:Histone deacetylase interacting domain-containing protein n=1 Tax=Capsella rubella TaxID=81985 RepID=R0I4U6_9BRAS|nr:hypothetical protein CARUB_v10011000mg [Capsella rubella]
MVGRSVTPTPTFADALSYVRSVKEAFHDEPAKYREFLKLMKDYRHSRGVDANSVFARVEALLKDHRNLLLGFSVFLPAGTTITIPPEPDKARSTSVKEDLNSYLTAVKKAFRDNPLKYYVFFKHFCDLRRDSVIDIADGIEYLEELLKDHQSLFLRLIAFLPAETQRLLHQRNASDDNKRKRVKSFIGKLKARFQLQEDGRHVYESFLEIMKVYQEGNKSVKELYKEVISLVQGHEDLITEFSEIFKNH